MGLDSTLVFGLVWFGLIVGYMQRRTTTTLGTPQDSGSPDASPQVCPPGDDDDGQLVSADLATASAWPWWTVPVALASLLIGALLVVLSIAADHLENLGGSLDGIENPLASVKDASLHHKLRNKVRNMTMPKGIVTAADGQMLTAGAASHFDEPPPPPPPSPPPPSPPHPPVVHPQVERVEEQADLVNTVERMGMHVPLDLHKPKLSKKEQKRIALLRGEDEGYTKSFTKKSRKAFHSAMDMSGSTKASTKETELHFRG